MYGQTADVDGDEIRWQSSAVQSIEEVVQGVVGTIDESGDLLPDSHTAACVKRVLLSQVRANGGGVAVTPDAFLQALDAEVASYLRQTKKLFEYHTSLSVGDCPIRRMRYGEVCFNKTATPDFRSIASVDSIVQYESPLRPHLLTSGYQWFCAEVEARCECVASEKAELAVAVVCATWNFASSYRRSTMHYGVPQFRPVGRVHIGPLQLVREAGGDFNRFRYDPALPPSYDLYRPPATGVTWIALERCRRRIMSDLRQSAFRCDIERLLTMYSRALSDPNLQSAFLGLWKILEHVTDTVGGPYEKTVDRAAWYERDRRPTREYLRFLQTRRNASVHSMSPDDDAQIATAILKDQVDMHLGAAIVNEHGVGSLSEYGELLSSPSDAQALAKKHKLLQAAMRARGIELPQMSD